MVSYAPGSPSHPPTPRAWRARRRRSARPARAAAQVPAADVGRVIPRCPRPATSVPAADAAVGKGPAERGFDPRTCWVSSFGQCTRDAGPLTWREPMWVWLPPVSVLRALGRAVSDISPPPDLCPECALVHSSPLPTPRWAVSDLSPPPDPNSQCALLGRAVSDISPPPDPNPEALPDRAVST